MEEEIKIIAELIENCGHTAKLLIKSEIALNDGDVNACQKCVSEAQSVMSVMVRDVFNEMEETFALPVEDSVDYDLPNSLELANQLNEITYNAATLLSMIIENENENIKQISKKKLSAHITTAREIYNSLFNN